MLIPKFNLANRITIARLAVALLCFVFLILIQEGQVDSTEMRSRYAWIALSLFLLATVTDALDGYIARRDGTVTAFGRIADPLVDKITVCGSLLFLTVIPETGVFLAPWMVAVVLFREFLVNGIRGYMESVGISFGAEMPGKIKMVVQSVAIGLLIGLLALSPAPPAWIEFLTRIAVWATVISTIGSGLHYVIKASRHIGAEDI